MIHLNIHNEVKMRIPSRLKINRWLSHVLYNQNIHAASLDLTIVSKRKIKMLNRRYRNKNKVTNILSFSFEPPPGLPKENKITVFLGDLIICADQVKYESKIQGKLIEHHWCHLLVHGTLHLLGYDHISEKEGDRMESLEISLLEKLRIKNPYIGN